MAAPRKIPAENLPRPSKRPAEILQAMLEANSDLEVLTVRFGEDELDFHYRPLGWLAKSRCVSAATEYSSDINPETKAQVVRANFRYDIFKKAALREMISNPPFPLTDSLLDRLPEEVGAQFDAIIPDPFSSGAGAAMGKDSGS
jgi:hypothetical protein